MTEAEQEQAAVVAWLRREADELAEEALMSGVASEMARALQLMDAARKIERGDHLED